MQILFKKPNSSFGPKDFLPGVLKNIKPVIYISSDLKVKFVNTNCENLLKYTNQNLIGKKLNQLFEAPDTLAPTLYNDGYTLDTYILDSQKNKIPVSVSVKKIKNASKSPEFILILTDITENQKNYRLLQEKSQEIEQKKELLKKLQKELEIVNASVEEKIKILSADFEKEHSRLLAAINNLSLCFLMTDKYNNIILTNKTAKKTFPFLNKEKIITITELQNSSLMNLDLNTQVNNARNEKKCTNMLDVQVDSKFIDIFISPMIIESQPNLDAIGTALIIEDQTTQHELERSKEDLFNIASHELRTPLTAIYGYTALIKQIYFGNIQNEELKSIINAIGVLSKKLSLSVSNFLDSSKLEQGKIELKEEQCNLFTLINESIKEMESIALWKNLYIKFDPPPSPIIITADKTRITQILNIFISNAIKFTRIGGIYISVEKKTNLVKIIIEDTGTGINEENKKLLFRKFQRAGENLLTREEGSGLGLHIANLLVKKMGGTIALEKTEINKGSAFSFTIPMTNN